MRAGFLVNEVYTGLRRNVTMPIAMILTTAISVGLFGGGLLVVRLADQSRNIYLDRVESQVFLAPDVSANDATCDGDACKALRGQIEARDDRSFLGEAQRAGRADARCGTGDECDLALKSAHAASYLRTLRTSPMRIVNPVRSK